MTTCNLVKATIVIDHTVRSLCREPYPLHPRGCPNFGKKPTCPPHAPRFEDTYDLSKPAYCVVNEFDLGAHITAMRKRHPDWSSRQLRCCLYWQGTARKRLEQGIAAALLDPKLTGLVAERSPEAMGVDVTATLRGAGIELEWPPERIARQVAILAFPRRRPKAEPPKH
jgi:predicted metal-binding protein